MKTLFICSEDLIYNHIDEEYDEIYIVDGKDVNGRDNKITTENIEEWTFKLKDVVRIVVNKVAVEPEKVVKVFMDCPGPYHWIMENIKIEMSNNEQIKLILPELKGVRPADDIIKEDQEVKEKIKKIQQENENA